MAKQESSKAKQNDDKRALEEEEELDDDEEGLDDEEEDLDDEEDELEDEEEEDRGRREHVAPAVKVAEAEDEQPGWWLPHLVLGVLVAAGVLGFLGFFGSFLAKKDGVQHVTSGSASAAAPSAAPAAPTAPQPTARPQPPRTAQPAPPPSDILGAKRIVVRYKGSEGSAATVERSKDDAKKRAEEALKKIQGGAKFEEVAGEYSDEPGAKSTGGNMGNFKKDVYPGLTKVLEPTKIGDMTGVVETPYGYEILIRTK